MQRRQSEEREYPFAKGAAFFSFPLEILVRRDFGERYHTAIKASGHVLWLSALGALAYWLSAVSLTTVLFGIFALAVLIASIFHKVAIEKRKHRNDEYRYSQHDGDSRDFWFTLSSSVSTVKTWLEPLPFLLAGTFFVPLRVKVFRRLPAVLRPCNGIQQSDRLQHRPARNP